MAVTPIKTVQNNTAPPIQFTVERSGSPIDVTGCTVALVITRGTTVTNTGHQTCTLVTPSAGIVRYTPQTGDFPSPGTYKGDIKITYADTTVEYLYEQAKFKVRKKVQ